jgi:ribosomal protein L29
MKKNMKNAEFHKMDAKSLQAEADALRLKLFTQKMNMVTGQVKDYSQFKKLRADIARALTCLRQKQSV